MDEKVQAIHSLREAIKYLLRTPDLNLDCLEDDTIAGIDLARATIKATERFCPFAKLFTEGKKT
jgi:hypothetical protein